MNNDIEGCNIVTFNTNHPHLAVGSAVYWDDTWQIPVYDEGLWTIGVIRSDGRFYRQLLNGEIYNWPKAIAMQICDQLAAAGAYLGEARDREVNDGNREAHSLFLAYSEHSAWRGRNDADYEANRGRS